jgi:hypothetical protein
VRDEDLVAGARCDDDDLAACEVPSTETSPATSTCNSSNM